MVKFCRFECWQWSCSFWGLVTIQGNATPGPLQNALQKCLWLSTKFIVLLCCQDGNFCHQGNDALCAWQQNSFCAWHSSLCHVLCLGGCTVWYFWYFKQNQHSEYPHCSWLDQAVKDQSLCDITLMWSWGTDHIKRKHWSVEPFCAVFQACIFVVRSCSLYISITKSFFHAVAQTAN